MAVNVPVPLSLWSPEASLRRWEPVSCLELAFLGFVFSNAPHAQNWQPSLLEQQWEDSWSLLLASVSRRKLVGLLRMKAGSGVELPLSS